MTEPKQEPYRVVESTEKVNGLSHHVRKTFDGDGQLIQEVLSPLMLEFRLRDALEIIVGAMVLAIPVAYTEEVWVLAEELPVANTIAVLVTSISISALFVYFVFYKGHLRETLSQFFFRVFANYGLTLLVVTLLLAMFGKLPWLDDPTVAIRRILLVGFPACFSATVVDSFAGDP